MDIDIFLINDVFLFDSGNNFICLRCGRSPRVKRLSLLESSCLKLLLIRQEESLLVNVFIEGVFKMHQLTFSCIDVYQAMSELQKVLEEYASECTLNIETYLGGYKLSDNIYWKKINESSGEQTTGFKLSSG
ncbi:hypothetical protein [Pseudomonas sp. GZD-222]|uniref:hypothetical protein n=1 Tax=Pseudomonas sp. GZD-222 TaxID=3404805 RepID=UPI003BB6948C